MGFGAHQFQRIAQSPANRDDQNRYRRARTPGTRRQQPVNKQVAGIAVKSRGFHVVQRSGFDQFGVKPHAHVLHQDGHQHPYPVERERVIVSLRILEKQVSVAGGLMFDPLRPVIKFS